MKSGNLNFLEPSGPLQACNRTAYHIILEILIIFLEDLAAFIFREEVTYSEEGSSDFL